MTLSLKASPDWAGAAQDLVDALACQSDAQRRVVVLERIGHALGDALYPAFIKLLVVVARQGDPEVRGMLAHTVARTIAVDRLPTTRLPAWGSRSLVGMTGRALPTRPVGPLEFLCIWLVRDIASEPADEAACEQALQLLIDMIESSTEAAEQYRAKLAADLQDPTEGLHTAASRVVVAALGEAWNRKLGGRKIAAAAVQAARQTRDPARRWSSPGSPGRS